MIVGYVKINQIDSIIYSNKNGIYRQHYSIPSDTLDTIPNISEFKHLYKISNGVDAFYVYHEIESQYLIKKNEFFTSVDKSDKWFKIYDDENLEFIKKLE